MPESNPRGWFWQSALGSMALSRAEPVDRHDVLHLALWQRLRLAQARHLQPFEQAFGPMTPDRPRALERGTGFSCQRSPDVSTFFAMSLDPHGRERLMRHTGCRT